MAGHRAAWSARPIAPVARLARPITLAAVVSATVLLFMTAPRPEAPIGWLFHTVSLWYLVPGAIIILRRDGHLIGWLLAVNALLWAIQLGSGTQDSPQPWPPVAWQAWISQWVGNAQWAATVALFVLFPEGLADRPPRQRRADRAMIATAVAVAVAGMFTTHTASDAFPQALANPTGLGFLPGATVMAGVAIVAMVGLSSVVALWRRARHVTGARRQQYRWLLFAFTLVMAGLASGLLLGQIIGEAAWLPIVVGWLLIPVAFCVAILRYRLYDIDRIISRTVTYALITLIVAAIYTTLVIALPELSNLQGPLPVAAATLTAAAAFTPVRRTTQRWVDRHFNRARYDARQELDTFATRLRAEVDLDTITTDIHTLVTTTVQPTTATLWIRGPRTRIAPERG